MSTIVWKRYIHSWWETIEAVREKDPDNFFILLHNKRWVSRKVFDLKPFELELLNDTFLQDYMIFNIANSHLVPNQHGEWFNGEWSIYLMKNKKC